MKSHFYISNTFSIILYIIKQVLNKGKCYGLVYFGTVFHRKMFKARGILCNIDLKLTNQLELVEGSTYKTGVKGLGE